MTQVDPFVYPIPQRLQEDPEVRAYFEYFSRWAHDMWLRTGGSEDAVSDTGVRESYPWAQDFIGDDKNSIQALYSCGTETQIITTKTISRETYTAVDNMFVYMTNDSTLYLPANPVRNSVVYMTKDASRSRVNGNGKTINGKSEYVYYRPELARVFQYFIDSDEWRIR